MNRATKKAVRRAADHDDRAEATYLLALHAVNGAVDDEKLDDVEALVEAAFAPKARTFGLVAPEPLTTLRKEINLRRAGMERRCRWCEEPLTNKGASRYCSDNCQIEDLGEEPSEEKEEHGN